MKSKNTISIVVDTIVKKADSQNLLDEVSHSKTIIAFDF
jgi:hypothetical protein